MRNDSKGEVKQMASRENDLNKSICMEQRKLRRSCLLQTRYLQAQLRMISNLKNYKLETQKKSEVSDSEADLLVFFLSQKYFNQ